MPAYLRTAPACDLGGVRASRLIWADRWRPSPGQAKSNRLHDRLYNEYQVFSATSKIIALVVTPHFAKSAHSCYAVTSFATEQTDSHPDHTQRKLTTDSAAQDVFGNLAVTGR